MVSDRALNHLERLHRSVWSIMKELIVLFFLFSLGVGEDYEAIKELSELQQTWLNHLTQAVHETELLAEMADEQRLRLQKIFEHSCIDQKTFDGLLLEWSTEMEATNLPLFDWIQRTFDKLSTLGLSLTQLLTREDLIDSDLDRHLTQSFIGDCQLPSNIPLRQKSVNTNDIYEYQNKLNCEIGGSEEFQCGSGECIDFNRTCDGTFDCWDGSDELGACEERTGCERCPGYCVMGPKGPQCVDNCPLGFEYPMKVCPSSKPCYTLCHRKGQRRTISANCLVQILNRLIVVIENKHHDLMYQTYLDISKLNRACHEIKSNHNDKTNLATIDKTNSLEGQNTTSPPKEPTTSYSTWPPTSRHPTWHPTTRHPTWPPTSRHPTWHPTTRHPTWQPTTRHPTWHPTWHPTTRHPTWHPTTRHPTWPPTSRHPTWHPTTRHPTWNPTTSHPTWHPTTRHPTWHPTWHPTTRHPTWHPTWHPTTRHPTWPPTSRHPTWHPTTRHPTWHPTWHPTTRHPTWHPTSRHPTWHPTSRHPTWHPTTSHPTWHPTTSGSMWDSDYSIQIFDENKHHTTKHTTPHSTTKRHHTTKHHTTKHTTHHTTTPITPTTNTTPHTTTTSKTTTSSTTTTTSKAPFAFIL